MLPMAIKRSYDDGCAAAHALDVIGERWALLIVRELLLGPKRFTDLRSGLPTISPNVLTQRLTELDASSVVRRYKLSSPSNAWVYGLTAWGTELEPVVLELARWGVRSPNFLRGAPLGVDALVLSFKAMFDPSLASVAKVCIELQFGNDVFYVWCADSLLNVSRSTDQPVAASVSTDTHTLLHLTYGKADLNAAVQQGKLKYVGDESALRTFLRLFTLPQAAA